jgi:hypothetical protein
MRSGLIGGLVVLVLGGSLLPGCSIGSQKPGVITPAQATGVVRTWWTANERAAQSSDPKVWTNLKSGLQEQLSEAVTAARAALKSPAPQPRPISKVQVYLSRQSSYPAFFTASLRTVTQDASGQITDTPDIEMLDFSRPSSSERWKLINGVALATNPVPQFQFDSDGYVVAPARVPAPLIKPGQVSTAWTGYLNGVVQGKPDSEIFAPSEMTSTLASDLKSVATGGPLESVRVEVYAESGYQSQTLSDGSLLVFFTATYDIRHTLMSGYCTVQSASYEPWGDLVTPGRYAVIDFESAAFAVAVVPARDSKAKVKVYGYSDNYLANTASAGC